MTERKRRLYRAVITDGYGERLLEVSGPDSEVWSYFGPGTSRCYQSKRAAENRAAMWRAHGCTVRVDVSEPIVWTEGEAA